VNYPHGFRVRPHLLHIGDKTYPHYMDIRSILRLIFLVALLQWLTIGAAHAGSELPRFLDTISTQDIFPGADRLGSPTGDPLVAPVFKQGKPIGFVFGGHHPESFTG